jgi:hypothetical protein
MLELWARVGRREGLNSPEWSDSPNCSQTEIDEIVRSPELIEAAREQLRRTYSSSSTSRNGTPSFVWPMTYRRTFSWRCEREEPPYRRPTVAKRIAG